MKKIMFVLLLIGSVQARAQATLEEIVNEGIALHDKGDYKGAVDKYKEALAIDPLSGLVHYELAFSYHLDKAYEQALHHADLAIKHGDEKTALHAAIIKGSVLDDMGNTRESVNFYKKILKQHPTQYLLLYNYAVSCGRINLWDEAEDALEKAIHYEFSHPSSHLKLAYIKADKREKIRAVYELYFFLILENKTPRAKEALNKLYELLYGNAHVDSVTVDQAGNKQININLYMDPGSDSRMMAAELSIAALTSASIELNKGKSFEEKFINDTQNLFSMLGELKEDRKASKSKKKKKEEPKQEIIWDVYAPFFYALNKAGHTEAFCYHILQASPNDQQKQWMEQNKEKLEYFYLWINNH